jgi:hypothetical protein
MPSIHSMPLAAAVESQKSLNPKLIYSLIVASNSNHPSRNLPALQQSVRLNRNKCVGRAVHPGTPASTTSLARLVELTHLAKTERTLLPTGVIILSTECTPPLRPTSSTPSTI